MPATLKRQSRSDRAAAILDVAALRLNARGISDELFGDIASDLGITRPALYSHFADRDELLFACYEHTSHTLENLFLDVGRSAADEADHFERFLGAAIREEFPELAVVAEVEVLTAPKRQIIREDWQRLVGHISKVAKAGAAKNILRPINPMVLANSVLGLAMWAPLQRRLLPNRPIASVLSGTREFFFTGLATNRTASATMPSETERARAAEVDLFDRAEVAAAKRDALLGAASALFNRRGVGATRIEEIAAAVGLNKRAIFRQFGSKDQLVAACFARANERILQIAQRASHDPSNRLEVVHTAVRQVVLALGDSKAPILTSHVGVGRLGPEAQAEMRERLGTLGLAYRDMLQQGIAEDTIRPIPVEDVVAALAGNLNWVASADWSEFTISLEQIAKELADIAIFGIMV